MQGKKWEVDDSSGARNSRVCHDCKTESPEVETNYTLISSRHGWRLHRAVEPDGRTVMQWRCPDCWARFRNRKPR